MLTSNCVQGGRVRHLQRRALAQARDRHVAHAVDKQEGYAGRVCGRCRCSNHHRPCNVLARCEGAANQSAERHSVLQELCSFPLLVNQSSTPLKASTKC